LGCVLAETAHARVQENHGCKPGRDQTPPKETNEERRINSEYATMKSTTKATKATKNPRPNMTMTE